MRKALEDLDEGVNIAGRIVNNLRYADDTTLIATTENGCRELLERVCKESEKVGLYLNAKKTKIMVFGTEEVPDIKVNGVVGNCAKLQLSGRVLVQ